MDQDKSSDNWLDRYGKELVGTSDALFGPLEINSKEVDLLLEIAKVVAHGTERKNAPLATYLVGRYVASRKIQDNSVSIEAVIVEALRLAESMVDLDE